MDFFFGLDSMRRTGGIVDWSTGRICWNGKMDGELCLRLVGTDFEKFQDFLIRIVACFVSSLWMLFSRRGISVLVSGE